MTVLYFYACLILQLTSVAGQPVQYILKGRDAVLSPALPSAPDDILWKHNGDKVISFDSAGEHVFPPYEGRVTLRHESAELTIADVRYQDSGEYELDALIRDRLHRSQYMLKVLDKVSKPVIRCKMSDESGDSTVRRTTLLCSSDSDTPETLTYKWNLEGKSQLGQKLSITLGNEHDHMEYSCTATNPLQAETSVFMAKDCYTGLILSSSQETSSEALYITVSTVIGSLILLAILLVFMFCLKKKRVCSKQRKNVDLENEAAETDDKSKDESRPLIESKENDDVEITSQKEDMQQLPEADQLSHSPSSDPQTLLLKTHDHEEALNNSTPEVLPKTDTAGDSIHSDQQETVKASEEKGNVHENLAHAEPHSETLTEEENKTGTDKRQTDTNHVPELERGSDSDSQDDEFFDAKQLQGNVHEKIEIFENLVHAGPHSETLAEEENEMGRDTRQTDTNHVPELETAKASEEKDAVPQPPHQSNVSVSHQYSQPDTVKSESEEETRPDGTSTSASELKDRSTDTSQNESVTSDYKATGESKLFNDSQRLPLPSNLSESLPLSPASVQDKETVSSDNYNDNTKDSAPTDVQPPDTQQLACSKQIKNVDLENEATETDDKSKDESRPLIEPKENDVVEMTLQKEGHVHEMVKKFENLDPMEPCSDTPTVLTEEENETGTDKRQTDTNHVPELERGSNSDSQDNELYDASKHQVQPSHSPSSDPQALHNCTPEVLPKTDTAGDTIHSDQQETVKASEGKDPVPQPRQSDVSVSHQYSQANTVKSESRELTRPKDTSTLASELKDPQTDVPQNESVTSEHKPTGKSKLFNDSQRLPQLCNQPAVDSASSELKEIQDSGANVKSDSTEKKPHAPDPPSEEFKETKQTRTTENTSTDDFKQPGSVKEEAKSTLPPASALSQSTHEKESKDTDAENVSFAQVSEETEGNTDKETDSQDSEQINEATKEGQQ